MDDRTHHSLRNLQQIFLQTSLFLAKSQNCETSPSIENSIKAPEQGGILTEVCNAVVDASDFIPCVIESFVDKGVIHCDSSLFCLPKLRGDP